jgi:NADPH2:quinone reductase
LVAGIGYPDVLIREGTYPGGPKSPFTPGYEFIGVVDKLGTGVEGLQLGQTVGAITVYGSHADYLCVPAWWLVAVPVGLDPAEAVIVVFNYMTAYQMLHRTARVRQGERRAPDALIERRIASVDEPSVHVRRVDEFLTSKFTGVKPLLDRK